MLFRSMQVRGDHDKVDGLGLSLLIKDGDDNVLPHHRHAADRDSSG